MKKIILSVMVSLDGFIEGPDREIDWHNWNDDMDEYMSSFFKNVDTIILGRTAYELMANYWPTAAAESENPLIAHKMNKLAKLVYSKTLTKAEWRNTSIIHELKKEDILKLKENAEKDIVIFGGAEIAQSFIKHKLIDEFRLIVNPVVLGKGKPLFDNNSDQKIHLKLLNCIPNGSGNVIICYHPSDNINS